MMSMKKYLLTYILILCPILLLSQEEKTSRKKVKTEDTIEIIDTLTDEFLDTVKIDKKLRLNDYSLIGLQYGAGLS